MNRRTFLKGTSFGGGAIAGVQIPALAMTRKPGQNARDYYDFSADGRECIIKRHDTPIPWMNLLTNDDFQTWVTHGGNIEAFMLDRGLGGLTNPQEISGYIYLKDHTTGRYFMLNRPAVDGFWHSVHGLGYTTVMSGALELIGNVTYFVPRDENILVWLITIRNTAARTRSIDVFSTVEWSLGDQNKQIVFRGHGGGGDGFTGGSQFNLYKKVYLENGIVYATQNVWRTLGLGAKPWPWTGFLASSLPVRSFDCIKTNFVGRGHSLENPVAVERGGCSNTPFWSLNEFPWGVLHNTVNIRPRSEETLVIVLGMVRDKPDAAKIAKKYSVVMNAVTELEKVKSSWRDFTEQTLTVETPEKEIDRNINIWSKYQWRTNMFRSQNSGLRGLGFWSYGLMSGRIGSSIREVIVQPHDLKLAKESIVTYMQGQYRDFKSHMFSESQPLLRYSDLAYEWPPKPGKGLSLPHAHESDNAYAVCLYLKETGDLSFLDEMVPFVDGREGTVFDHLACNVENSLLGLSPRGLPRLNIGIGDWNDELNMISREAKAETIMFAMTICFTLRECAEIARVYGKEKQATAWMEAYQSIKDAINKYAWDGEWYVRAFADGEKDLVPIGASGNKEGKIYLNVQSWAVLSGVAEGERIQKCMDSMDKHLMSDYGPLIYGPPYSKFDQHVGVASTYAPGWRNGCIYLRPAGWAIMAACVANRPDQAFRMYQSASLSNVARDIDRFQHEPYVYPENYVGPSHPRAGEGQYQWCLGEGANWMWHSWVYYMLGIRPLLNGLLVDPRIPAHWKGFKVKRAFRDCAYEIEVANPAGVSMGVRSMLVDGQTAGGNIIPAHRDGRTHKVNVILGV